MAKRAVSVTLDEANLLWLKGQGYGHGNLSAAVDDLITAARAGRFGVPAAVRSVVGTIDLAADDPELERADSVVRDLFAASLARPLQVSEYARAIRASSARQALTPSWLIYPQPSPTPTLSFSTRPPVERWGAGRRRTSRRASASRRSCSCRWP